MKSFFVIIILIFSYTSNSYAEGGTDGGPKTIKPNDGYILNNNPFLKEAPITGILGGVDTGGLKVPTKDIKDINETLKKGFDFYQKEVLKDQFIDIKYFNMDNGSLIESARLLDSLTKK